MRSFDLHVLFALKELNRGTKLGLRPSAAIDGRGLKVLAVGTIAVGLLAGCGSSNNAPTGSTTRHVTGEGKLGSAAATVSTNGDAGATSAPTIRSRIYDAPGLYPSQGACVPNTAVPLTQAASDALSAFEQQHPGVLVVTGCRGGDMWVRTEAQGQAACTRFDAHWPSQVDRNAPGGIWISYGGTAANSSGSLNC